MNQRQFITKNGMWLTIDEIVDDLEQRISLADKKELAQMEEGALAALHHGFGTWIRNSYDLWHGNPITEKWRTDESSRNMVNGVDHSEDHPDAVSMKIIRLFHARVAYLKKP